MLLLVQIGFIHYGPKNSEEGIKELVIADSIEKVIKYIDKTYLKNRLFKDEDYNEETECSLPKENFDGKQEQLATADQFNVVIKDKGYSWLDFSGTRKNLILFMRGNSWEEIEDAYYGITKWDWFNQQTISEEEATILLKLNLVKDLRNEQLT